MTIQILLAALFLAAVLWLGFRAAPETEGAPVRRARIKEAAVFGLPPVPVFCAVLALGLILRFILGYNINGFEANISCFKAWAAYTHDYGFNNMYYRDFFLDYPPGYLYVLYIVEAFRRLFGVDQYAQSYTLMIKLAPILSDIACAAALWVLARKKLGEKSALLIAFKGVHYEIIVDVDGFKWMIQTTDSANVGDKIGLALTPDDIHVMAKSVYSGTMGDYSTFSDEMEEALQEEGSEHED